MLTRVQKTNNVNAIRPIMTGVQVAPLSTAVELATTKVLIQCAPTLLRMRLDQNPIVGKRGVTGRDQEHQCLVAIRVVLDLVGLRMR